MAVPPNPPTLTIQSATDSRGYNIPYNKLLFVPSECSPGTPNCPDILLHGKLSFKTLLQNNNNPIDYLVCRLDGRYAYQAREYHFPAAALAQILDRILPDKILVPAKQANVRIRLMSRNSTVSEIVKSSGFILKG